MISRPARKEILFSLHHDIADSPMVVTPSGRVRFFRFPEKEKV